jgi:hypothetical protein
LALVPLRILRHWRRPRARWRFPRPGRQSTGLPCRRRRRNRWPRRPHLPPGTGGEDWRGGRPSPGRSRRQSHRGTPPPAVRPGKPRRRSASSAGPRKRLRRSRVDHQEPGGAPGNGNQAIQGPAVFRVDHLETQALAHAVGRRLAGGDGHGVAGGFIAGPETGNVEANLVGAGHVGDEGGPDPEKESRSASLSSGLESNDQLKWSESPEVEEDPERRGSPPPPRGLPDPDRRRRRETTSSSRPSPGR